MYVLYDIHFDFGVSDELNNGFNVVKDLKTQFFTMLWPVKTTLKSFKRDGQKRNHFLNNAILKHIPVKPREA